MSSIYGFLADTAPGFGAVLLIAAIAGLGFVGAKLVVWTALIAAALVLFGASPMWWIVFGIPLLILNIKPLRRNLLTRSLVNLLKKTKHFTRDF